MTYHSLHFLGRLLVRYSRLAVLVEYDRFDIVVHNDGIQAGVYIQGPNKHMPAVERNETKSTVSAEEMETVKSIPFSIRLNDVFCPHFLLCTVLFSYVSQIYPLLLLFLTVAIFYLLS